MPKIKYKKFNFRYEKLLNIARCNEIITDFTAQGFKLTVRQLYYQFVTKNYIKNTKNSYANFVNVVNDGRLAGMIDWDAIEDRTRNLQTNAHWDDPEDIIKQAALGYAIDKWEGQPYRPEIWVEKEALSGVFDRICRKLDIPFFACRGYVSQSEMWSHSQRFKRTHERGQVPTIIHLGDHDPSGIDMTRDIFDRMKLFMGGLQVDRIALNMAQIDLHRPPPNFAKATDTRFKDYEDLYGNSSWELDALSPAILVKMVEERVVSLRDDELWDEKVEKEAEDKRLLSDVAGRWSEVVNFIDRDVE